MYVKEASNKFSPVLSEDDIKKLERKYGVKCEQERKLLAVSFFWLMLLSTIKSNPQVGLSN